MIAGSPNAPAAMGFQPFAALLATFQPDRLAEARWRVAELDRGELLTRFQRAFADGRRLTAFLMAEELVRLGIPPSFWRSYPSTPARELEVNRRFDLLLYDLQWLRHWYPEHPKTLRYGRYRDLFKAHDPAFHRAAEYVFYAGSRPVWKIVGSLSMTETQQWDCSLLRSAPIHKRQAATDAMRGKVHTAIEAGLAGAGRTAQFTDADAEITLARRHALWLCSRMGDLKSPTHIAARYEQMTGQGITRQIASRQLELVRETLAKSA
jgi:hypothetical protein